MKILITGFNKNQCTRMHYLKQRLKVLSGHYSLFNCLTAMGHEVEQRPVVIGEDLSEYDDVFVFLADPGSMVVGNLFEGLWAIAQRPDCVIAYDDWQVPYVFGSLNDLLPLNEDALYRKFILGNNNKTLEELQPHTPVFEKALRQIVSMQNRVLVNVFDASHLGDSEQYGPHLLFAPYDYPRDRIFGYNPNPYNRNRTWEDHAHIGHENPDWTPPLVSLDSPPRPVKERRFNFASLVQSKTRKWLKQQGYTGKPKDPEQGFIGGWPVDLYGSKADSQKRLTEDEMVKVITRDWGCLLPGYVHGGSGWWRIRVLQCADAASVLVGDPKDFVIYYGADYPYLDLKASDLPDMSDEELQLVADLQRESLYTLHPLDQNVQQRELQLVLTAPKE